MLRPCSSWPTRSQTRKTFLLTLDYRRNSRLVRNWLAKTSARLQRHLRRTWTRGRTLLTTMKRQRMLLSSPPSWLALRPKSRASLCPQTMTTWTWMSTTTQRARRQKMALTTATSTPMSSRIARKRKRTIPSARPTPLSSLRLPKATTATLRSTSTSTRRATFTSITKSSLAPTLSVLSGSLSGKANAQTSSLWAPSCPRSRFGTWTRTRATLSPSLAA
mmetsp:Transcript_14985/g.20328  ORF Transcript_14985/g.20328 Transcript_14985/m.20328 type:complete len:219 (+) Transcript_14985:119-775(+)